MQTFIKHPCFFVLMVLALVPVCASPADQHFAPKDLEALLCAFAELPTDAALDGWRTNWPAVLRAARAIQNASPQSVESALREFQDPRKRIINTAEDLKIFLLLRVVFEVPEHADGKERNGKFTDGLITMGSDLNGDGRFNAAWPLSWKTGVPQLVTGLRGYQGHRYDAPGEYAEFLKRYKFRDLAPQEK